MNSKAIEKIFFWTTNSAYFRRYELTLWYYQHLLTKKILNSQIIEDEAESNKLLYIKDVNEELYYRDLEILLSYPSIEAKPKKLDPLLDDTSQVSNIQTNDIQTKTNKLRSENFIVNEKSRVIQMCTKYRIVFSIDISASMGSIDPKSGRPFFSYVFACLKKCLKSLVKEITLKTSDNTEIILKPELYISIIAQSTSEDSLILLIQGVLLSEKNVNQVISEIKEKFSNIELFAAKKRSEMMSSSEAQKKLLSSILNRAYLSLSLLPNDASSRVVIITDGVSQMNESESFDTMITKFNREDISITFIQVTQFDPSFSLGYIPDYDLQRALASKTGGTCLDRDTVNKYAMTYCSSSVIHRNLFQSNLLFREFSLTEGSTLCSNHEHALDNRYCIAPQHTLITPEDFSKCYSSLTRYNYDENIEEKSNAYFPWNPLSRPPPILFLSSKLIEYTIGVDLFTLMNSRICDGFIISPHFYSLKLTSEVEFEIEWRSNIRVSYVITSVVQESDQSFPIKSNIVINLITYYDFLKHWSAFQKKISQKKDEEEVFKNPHYLFAIQLHQFIFSIKEKDEILMQFINIKNKLFHEHVNSTNAENNSVLNFDYNSNNPVKEENKINVFHNNSNSNNIHSHNKLISSKVVHKEFEKLFKLLFEKKSEKWIQQHKVELIFASDCQCSSYSSVISESNNASNKLFSQQTQPATSHNTNMKVKVKNQTYKIATKLLMKVIKSWSNFSYSTESLRKRKTNNASNSNNGKNSNSNDKSNQKKKSSNSFIRIINSSVESYSTFSSFCLLYIKYTFVNIVELNFYFFGSVAKDRSLCLELFFSQLKNYGMLYFPQLTPSATLLNNNINDYHTNNPNTNIPLYSSSLEKSTSFYDNSAEHEEEELSNDGMDFRSSKIPQLAPFFYSLKPMKALLMRYSLSSKALFLSKWKQMSSPLNDLITQFRSPLAAYLLSTRKTYKFHNSRIIKTILEYIKTIRIREGFILVNNINNVYINRSNDKNVRSTLPIYCFLTQVPLQYENYNANNDHLLPCIFQYLIYSTSNYLITEFWMEPQYGLFIHYTAGKPDFICSETKQIFDIICKSIEAIDEHIVTSLYSISRLKDIRSEANPMFFNSGVLENKFKNKEDSNNEGNDNVDSIEDYLGNIVVPYSSISSVLSTARSSVHRYSIFKPAKMVTFSYNDTYSDNIQYNINFNNENAIMENHNNNVSNEQNSENTLDTSNEILASILEDELHSLSDCEIDTDADDWNFLILNQTYQRCRCFIKYTNSGLLVAIVPMLNQKMNIKSFVSSHGSGECDELIYLSEDRGELAKLNANNVDLLDFGDINTTKQLVVAFYECNASQILLLSDISSFFLYEFFPTHFNTSNSEVVTLTTSSSEKLDDILGSSDHASSDINVNISEGENKIEIVNTSEKSDHSSPMNSMNSIMNLLSDSEATLENLYNSTIIDMKSDPSIIDNNNTMVLSAAAKQYAKSLTLLYQQSFVKGVYTNYRDSLPVNLADFYRAVDYCREYPMDLDLTQYLRILQRSCQYHEEAIREIEENIQPQYYAIVKKFFKSIPEIPHYYYFCPEDVVDNSVEDDSMMEEETNINSNNSSSGNKDPMLDNSYNFSKDRKNKEVCEDENVMNSKTLMGVYPYPFFLKIEVHFEYYSNIDNSNPNNSGLFHHSLLNNDMVTPTPSAKAVKKESKSTSTSSIVNRLLNINQPQTNPSIYKKINMRQIPTLLEMDSIFGNDYTVINITLKFIQITIRSCKSSKAMKRVMKDFHDSVQSLLSRNILIAFMKIVPVTNGLIEIILYNMKRLSPNMKKSEVFNLYLLDHHLGKSMLPTELEKNFCFPVKRFKDVFFVVEYVRSQCESDPLLSKASRMVQEDSYRIPFWLFIAYKETTVTVTLFSHTMSTVEISRVLSQVRAFFRSFCDRINQLILLHQLHETKICSDLLVPNDENSPNLQNSLGSSLSKSNLEMRNSDNAPRSFYFNHFPGQFKCNLQKILLLKYHSRIPLNLAKAGILDSLQPFQVLNRNDLFVFQDKQKNVIYMVLNSNFKDYLQTRNRKKILGSSQDANVDVVDSNNLEYDSSELRNNVDFYGGDVNDEEDNNAEREQLSSMLKSYGFYFPSVQNKTGLTMEIYGVDPPLPETAKELFTLLRNKLNSTATFALTESFAKNSHLKLTKEDINFICGQSPSIHVHYTLSDIVSSQIASFFVYLKQNLKISFYYENFDRISTPRLEDNDDEISDLNHLFVYSYYPKGAPPDALSSMVGQGIAIIIISIEKLDEYNDDDIEGGDSNGVKEIERDESNNYKQKSHHDDTDGVRMNELIAYMENLYIKEFSTQTDYIWASMKNAACNSTVNIQRHEDIPEPSKKYKLKLIVWPHGLSLKTDQLLTHIEKCICHTYIDFSFEFSLFKNVKPENYPLSHEGNDSECSFNLITHSKSNIKDSQNQRCALKVAFPHVKKTLKLGVNLLSPSIHKAHINISHFNNLNFLNFFFEVQTVFKEISSKLSNPLYAWLANVNTDHLLSKIVGDNNNHENITLRKKPFDHVEAESAHMVTIEEPHFLSSLHILSNPLLSRQTNYDDYFDDDDDDTNDYSEAEKINEEDGENEGNLKNRKKNKEEVETLYMIFGNMNWSDDDAEFQKNLLYSPTKDISYITPHKCNRKFFMIIQFSLQKVIFHAYNWEKSLLLCDFHFLISRLFQVIEITAKFENYYFNKMEKIDHVIKKLQGQSHSFGVFYSNNSTNQRSSQRNANPAPSNVNDNIEVNLQIDTKGFYASAQRARSHLFNTINNNINNITKLLPRFSVKDEKYPKMIDNNYELYVQSIHQRYTMLFNDPTLKKLLKYWNMRSVKQPNSIRVNPAAPMAANNIESDVTRRDMLQFTTNSIPLYKTTEVFPFREYAIDHPQAVIDDIYLIKLFFSHIDVYLIALDIHPIPISEEKENIRTTNSGQNIAIINQSSSTSSSNNSNGNAPNSGVATDNNDIYHSGTLQLLNQTIIIHPNYTAKKMKDRVITKYYQKHQTGGILIIEFMIKAKYMEVKYYIRPFLNIKTKRNSLFPTYNIEKQFLKKVILTLQLVPLSSLIFDYHIFITQSILHLKTMKKPEPVAPSSHHHHHHQHLKSPTLSHKIIPTSSSSSSLDDNADVNNNNNNNNNHNNNTSSSSSNMSDYMKLHTGIWNGTLTDNEHSNQFNHYIQAALPEECTWISHILSSLFTKQSAETSIHNIINNNATASSSDSDDLDDHQSLSSSSPLLNLYKRKYYKRFHIPEDRRFRINRIKEVKIELKTWGLPIFDFADFLRNNCAEYHLLSYATPNSSPSSSSATKPHSPVVSPTPSPPIFAFDHSNVINHNNNNNNNSNNNIVNTTSVPNFNIVHNTNINITSTANPNNSNNSNNSNNNSNNATIEDDFEMIENDSTSPSSSSSSSSPSSSVKTASGYKNEVLPLHLLSSFKENVRGKYKNFIILSDYTLVADASGSFPHKLSTNALCNIDESKEEYICLRYFIVSFSTLQTTSLIFSPHITSLFHPQHSSKPQSTSSSQSSSSSSSSSSMNDPQIRSSDHLPPSRSKYHDRQCNDRNSINNNNNNEEIAVSPIGNKTIMQSSSPSSSSTLPYRQLRNSKEAASPTSFFTRTNSGSLDDHPNQATKGVSNTFEECKRHYFAHRLWDHFRLEDSSLLRITNEEKLIFFHTICPLEISEIDNSLIQFSNIELPFDDIIYHLRTLYRPYFRNVSISVVDDHHSSTEKLNSEFIFFNPKNAEKLLVYITVNKVEKKMTFYSCHRHSKVAAPQRSKEQIVDFKQLDAEHISLIVNAIIFVLWNKLLYS